MRKHGIGCHAIEARAKLGETHDVEGDEGSGDYDGDEQGHLNRGLATELIEQAATHDGSTGSLATLKPELPEETPWGEPVPRDEAANQPTSRTCWVAR